MPRAKKQDSSHKLNELYYGDNLDIMMRYIKDETVDLIYLDPPFNSNRNFNAFFAERDGSRAAAQIKAFGDTWRWDVASSRAYDSFIENGPYRASQAMQALRLFLGHTDMLAYLSMMAPRFVEMWRCLKPTGSLYLHCDPTASHYLKILLDGIFGPERFQSEIIWKRYGSHNDCKTYGSVHDVILFYAKSQSFKFYKQHEKHSESYISRRFRFADNDGRLWAEQNLSSPNPRPNLTYIYVAKNGISYDPPKNGWKCTLDRMKKLDDEGRLHYPAKQGGRLRLKSYLDELPGVPIQDVWVDVGAIGGNSPERLGYPTQKPEGLLERIIRSSSTEGDVVLDPFCGCGTAVAVANRLNRQWIGIDITHLAISLIRSRIHDSFGDASISTYKVIGEPTELPDAETLAKSDRYQFQYWALGLVGARPTRSDQKKGADKGIDGRLYFHDDSESEKTKQVIFSVKSGGLKPDDVRALSHVLEREKAEIGVLITLEDPTRPMRIDAASVGFYKSPWGTSHSRLQIITIEELLAGDRVDMPPSRDLRTFKKAPKAKREGRPNPMLPFDPE